MKTTKEYTRRAHLRNIIQEVLFYNKQLSVNECAKYLNKDYRTVMTSIRNKEIKAIRIGKSYSIPMLQFMPS